MAQSKKTLTAKAWIKKEKLSKTSYMFNNTNAYTLSESRLIQLLNGFAAQFKEKSPRKPRPSSTPIVKDDATSGDFATDKKGGK